GGNIQRLSESLRFRIPAFVGMTVGGLCGCWRIGGLKPTLQPSLLDSRFHGNDEVSDGIGIFVFWWAEAQPTIYGCGNEWQGVMVGWASACRSDGISDGI
ncbi:TPA: hypothetical protein ACFP4U_001711, partial [Neisseria lactamica]